MQRRNREINIFNMSALDLFASALGAFILLFVILMPYYLKTSKVVMQENAQLKAEIRQCQTEVSDLKAQVTDLQGQVDGLKQQLTSCEQQKQQLQAENDQLKQQMQNMQNDLQQAQEKLEDRVKFALLGITTTAQSFVLVIDMSGSMSKYTGTMKRTVSRILEPFEGKHKVQIFGFNESGYEAWQSPYDLAEMTDTNKQAANSFTGSLSSKFGGNTPTKSALLEALKYIDAEAIILLTDGAPTDADPADIVQSITTKNAGRKEIHTVAIGDYNAQPALVDFLQKLSANNGGAFVGAAK